MANGGHYDVILPHHHSRFERQIRYRLCNSSSGRCFPAYGVTPHHPYLFLGTSASNGNCLYLGAAVAVNAVPSFLLWGV